MKFILVKQNDAKGEWSGKGENEREMSKSW